MRIFFYRLSHSDLTKKRKQVAIFTCEIERYILSGCKYIAINFLTAVYVILTNKKVKSIKKINFHIRVQGHDRARI